MPPAEGGGDPEAQAASDTEPPGPAGVAQDPGLEEEGSRLFLPHRDGADGGYYSILLAPQENWPPVD